MGTVRLDIAYDGAGFSGWAAQPGERTVQGELEQALGTILRAEVALTVAGRTDTGVHASGQVASFEHAADPPPDLARRLNSILGQDVSVLAAVAAANGFDARRDARSRTYEYRVLAAPVADPLARERTLHWPHPLDAALLDACAAALVGTHDFTAFTPTQTEHVRFERDVLAAGWESGPRESPGGGELLRFRIEADAFMRHMVRILLGTMLEVAGGRRTLDEFERLLRGAPREQAGETAPAHGLCLVGVSY